MCTISYQKCVCVVFLVVLAILSCYGFRIDNLAMTDVSKRNSHASNSLLETAPFVSATHRLRHRRQLSAPRRRLHCPEVDASWKAYTADAVAVASYDTYKCKGTCTVEFQIHRWLKNPSSYNDQLIRLDFSTDRFSYCESDDPKRNKPFFLVKNTDQSKRYLLFLRTDGPHHYKAAYAPELNKTRIFKKVSRVVNSTDFKPSRTLKLDMIPPHENRKSPRVKLVCKVRGFPIPLITWKVNNTTLHPNNRIRITQKKRKSTLVIRRLLDSDGGQYECVARSVDGRSVHKVHTIQPRRPAEKPGINPITTTTTISNSDRKPCEPDLAENFCYNGGTCFLTESMKENSCECPNGFEGHKCEKKSSNYISMYRQTPLTTCKVGIYTKYDKC